MEVKKKKKKKKLRSVVSIYLYSVIVGVNRVIRCA